MASTRFGDNGVAIERLEVSAYTVPSDSPESDGTYAWDKTTIVIVEVSAGGKRGLGYTYADVSTATLVKTMLANVVQGYDAMNVPACWLAMVTSIRNLGRPGIASMAIAAVDAALWDSKARLLDVALVTLLGATRASAPIYDSGGFTSYSKEQLQQQFGNWVADGIPRVKVKVGTHPEDDLRRVSEAREVIEPDTEHCGPALHIHPCCAVPNFRYMEYFHDHVRIEHMFFDGVLTPLQGELRPDLSRPGMGLEFKHADAAEYAL